MPILRFYQDMLKPKKIVVVLFLICLSVNVFAQKKSNKYSSVENLRTFDNQKFHFGFLLGYNNSSYKLKNNLTNDTLNILEVENRPGFDIGLVSVYHISKNVKLRFTPNISFQDKQVEYTFFSPTLEKSTQDNQVIESTFIEFPLTLKLRTNRIKNFAAGILLGGKYAIDAASQKDKEDLGVPFLKTQEKDVSMIIGGSFDFFLEYFKFGVEIKYNHGFNNMLFQDQNIYSSPLDYLFSRVWSVTLTFEG
ncbi:MAG: porin family protein [Bacteroidia bacterium]